PSRTKAIVVTNGSITANGTVDISPTAPGIFTLNASGAGQAAALNQDGTLNSTSNAAKIGSVVVLYLTGEGAYTDIAAAVSGPDGYVIPAGTLATDPTMPLLSAPVSITLGSPAIAVPGANI